MRSSSLLGILLDFLDDYEKALPNPADVTLGRFFRGRRYLGSRDRRFIGDAAFAWFRQRLRGEIRWNTWLGRVGSSAPASGRMRHVGSILAISADGLFPWMAEETGEAARGLAAAAGEGWSATIERFVRDGGPDENDWPLDDLDRVSCELSTPKWILESLAERLGPGRAFDIVNSLLEPAPVDLRVNLARVEREIVRSELEALGKVEVEVTPRSPAGLRLRNRINLKQFVKRNPGWIEVQDEGSQLAAMAAAPESEESILDVCAGSGGKTLAMADLIRGDARFHCCDIDAAKLSEVLTRAEPLGLRSLTIHQISTEGELPRKLPRSADLVVVDAPCSGLGSLRRNPDLKYRYDLERILEFASTQRSILERFAERVRPGGRLLYVTCSILPEENEAVALDFLSSRDDFEIETPVIAERLPDASLSEEGFIRLDPATTGTDAFFIALFRRAERSRD